MHKTQAKFVSLGGREVTFPLIRSQGQLFVERPSGMLDVFADPLDDSILGQLSFVSVDPPDPKTQPENRRRVRDLARLHE
jgi:hypothetical protein